MVRMASSLAPGWVSRRHATGMIRTGRRRAAATAGPLRDSDIRVLRCRPANLTAPQIGGERCVSGTTPAQLTCGSRTKSSRWCDPESSTCE